jgi:hypothetical protein
MSAPPATAPNRGSVAPSSDLGAKLVTLAGLGLVGYGLMFLIRNFTGFIELGLTPEHVGGTPEQIQAFSPHLLHQSPPGGGGRLYYRPRGCGHRPRLARNSNWATLGPLDRIHCPRDRGWIGPALALRIWPRHAGPSRAHLPGCGHSARRDRAGAPGPGSLTAVSGRRARPGRVGRGGGSRPPDAGLAYRRSGAADS